LRFKADKNAHRACHTAHHSKALYSSILELSPEKMAYSTYLLRGFKTYPQNKVKMLLTPPKMRYIINV